ncbi:MAG: aldolase/citrate lyase family protein [Clostridia bacterium]|nr:aldolase/citrate lyase family protein [Clostridia bacterium]
MRRSMLFLPGNTPNIIVNGEILGSDAVILDLEDAVSPTEKDSARILVRNAIKLMGFGRCEIIVRINSIDTPYWKRDLEEIIPVRPSMIMPPKTGCAQDVLTVDAYISELEDKLGMARNTVRLIPLIETALGVENAYQIASASKRVAAIFLGGEDLSADLRCKRTKEGNEIAYARARMVVAARAAGVDVYDTPFTDVNDDEGIYTDAQYAKSLGFTGKSAISPRHVGAINEVFSPSQQDIDYAYEVMEAIRIGKEQGRGAVALRGKMIDAPVVMRAQQTIEMAQQLGLGRVE